MTNTKRSVLEAAQRLFFVVFALALIGLFVFGNYLMIGSHRPSHELLAEGFVYPIFGKGGIIYISGQDLKELIALVAVLVISMVCTNRIAKTLEQRRLGIQVWPPT